jgi:hypothetical protein
MPEPEKPTDWQARLTALKINQTGGSVQVPPINPDTSLWGSATPCWYEFATDNLSAVVPAGATKFPVTIIPWTVGMMSANDGYVCQCRLA